MMERAVSRALLGACFHDPPFPALCFDSATVMSSLICALPRSVTDLSDRAKLFGFMIVRLGIDGTRIAHAENCSAEARL